MPISFGKAKTVLCLLPLVATLGGAPYESPRETLRIRVSQESAPGAGDFDQHVLGFIEPWQTDQNAAAYYGRGHARYYGPNAGALTPNKAHVFFVNASDGLSMFVVLGAPNRMPEGVHGSAKTRFELSGGTAQVLLADDGGHEGWATNGGTVFIAEAGWGGGFTDGIVVGALPVGFSILGQFTEMPTGAGAKGMTGWMVISADGMAYPLAFAVGQRIRLDVRLVTDVDLGQS